MKCGRLLYREAMNKMMYGCIRWTLDIAKRGISVVYKVGKKVVLPASGGKTIPGIIARQPPLYVTLGMLGRP
jgi:hypothetical protein